ncbi:MAG: NAD(P)/FAD-dependent oxidoreductase [Treponema sp.]|jgi:glycerol-3-phosphate dehydrogenase|nr:NAD(P)/FAD-dependent oxidoreductase [Treponema sp.]
MYDAIVIGAGISGASVARELARYKMSVMVLEKGSDVCAGASRGNSATVHSGHDAKPGTLKARYNVLGNALYDDLCRELSVPFRRNGTIIFGTSEEDMAEIHRLKIQADENGVPGVEVLDRLGLMEKEPWFGEKVRGGLWAPSGGMVCPYTLVIALCENALQNGVRFSLDTELRALEREGAFWRLKTSRGIFEGKIVFNCAGTYADILNNMVSRRRFTIIPRKGEHIILDKRLGPYVRTTVCQTPVTLPGGGHTKGMGIMPSLDGTVILGCNARDAEDRDNTDTSAEGLNSILKFFEENWTHLPAAKALPRFPRDAVIGAFGGLRAHPGGDDFILGEAPDAEGFFNAAGIESPGLTAGPAVGKALVKEAAEKYGLVPREDFNPIRTVSPPFRGMSRNEQAAAVQQNGDYGKIVCRCEQVTRAEILAAIHTPPGARSLNAVKMRARAGMGRCQGGFCGPEVLKILAGELNCSPLEITQSGGNSRILSGKISGGDGP